MYIVFEGVDTSGKSTQIELLRDSYPNAIFTKEPGGTEIGIKIREMILKNGVQNHKSELFLFLADRAEHYHNIIKPNTRNIIFSDRSFISGIAYALANHNYDLEMLLSLNKFALNDKFPDKIVLLKTDKELILSRMQSKNEDMIEKRGIDYLLKVQNIMIEIVKKLEIDYKIIDANQTIKTIQTKIKGFIDD
jgi:dTMP kinase